MSTIPEFDKFYAEMVESLSKKLEEVHRILIEDLDPDKKVRRAKLEDKLDDIDDIVMEAALMLSRIRPHE